MRFHVNHSRPDLLQPNPTHRRRPLEKQVPRLFVYLMGQDDPKRCTAAKLARFGLALPVHKKSAILPHAVILDPYAPRTLMQTDRPFIASHGIIAVDCSWERADESLRGFKGETRRLPGLLAANPTKFSQLGVLSSVEALSAGLYIIGFEKQACLLLSKFKWGPHFLTLNEEPLREYAAAKSEAEVSEIERSFFG